MALVLDGTNGVSGVDGTASNPSLEGTDSNTGVFFPAADTVAIGTGGTEALRVNSSQNVGIGTTSPNYRLNVQSDSLQARFRAATNTNQGLTVGYDYSGGYGQINCDEAGVNQKDLWITGLNLIFGRNTSTERMRLDASGILLVGTTSASASLAAGGLQVTDRICVGTGSVGTPSLHASGDTNTGLYFPGADIVGFATGGTERARITSGGDLLVGKTSADIGVAGSRIISDGSLQLSRSGDYELLVNRLTNDGTLVEFRQDGTTEGTISVSGTTVSYNGGHLARYSQLLSGQRDESIVKGTVLSNLNEMCEWTDAEGNPLPNEQLNRMKVSDVEGDTNVAGVFVNWDNDDNDNPYDMNIAMTGDMIIRIAQGITVQKGDLLMSAGDGTAKPQGDDIVRSKTVAKVTSNHVTCTYEDGSYCVPCVLMAC